MQNIVVFTGAGVSVESGLGTFRDSGGLWEEYKIEDVATPAAFERNPELVLDFYNLRRKQLLESEPNAAHISLNKLSEKYKLHIITQNIDDLHERSGSKKVLHLHGKLIEARSSIDDKIYPKYLCVEFDLYLKQKDTQNKTQNVVNRLLSNNYKCLVNDNLNITFEYTL